MTRYTTDIAVVGLAVMGQNLILNLADKGFFVVAWNRTSTRVDDFLAGAARGTTIQGAHSAAAMAALLQCPRRVLLMVKAGDAVDDADLASLLLDPWFRQVVERSQNGWRRTVMLAAEHGIAAPGLSAALAFYDGYRCARSPANVIQAMRDYFGAHTFERTDHPHGVFFHHDWIGSGGSATSGSYTA